MEKESTFQRARQVQDGFCPFAGPLPARPDATSRAYLEVDNGKRSRSSCHG
jgi:hypothetical protein